MTRLPPPEQWALVKMNEMEVAEMIEKYIDYVDPKTGQSVHLRPAFVRHFMKREDFTADRDGNYNDADRTGRWRAADAGGARPASRHHL